MQLVFVTLTSAASPSGPSAEWLVEAFANHARDSEQLQHVRVRAKPWRYDIGMFLIATTRQVAHEAAQMICERALVREPALRGWMIGLS